jgi:hypothetical protein
MVDPQQERCMALYNPARAPPHDPSTQDAFARPPEVFGGWLPLIIATIVSIAIMTMFYSPLRPF